MLSLIGSRERDLTSWKRLFEAADPGFKFIGAKQPFACALSVVQAKFEKQGHAVNGVNGVNGTNGTNGVNGTNGDH